MVTQARGSNARRDSKAGGGTVAAELRQTREILAQRTRERDALQDERDALRQSIDALTQESAAAITQWRQRCEAYLDERLELAAALNGQPLTASPVFPSDIERIIAEKDAYIQHLESLLAANPISLMGSWITFRRQRRSGT